MLSGLLVLATTMGAHAQKAEPPAPQSKNADGAPDNADPVGLDVSEAIRLARVELDGIEAGDEAAPETSRSPIELGALPPSLETTTDSTGTIRPAAAATIAPPSTRPGGPQLQWLEDVVLPDIPVRWDDRLIEILDYYKNDPRGRQHARAWVQASGRYRAMIDQVLEEHRLPKALLYVAMVESGFDPSARSPAGAVGLWQFVTPTARDYGLEVDRWIDERMHPRRATEAAAAFFEDLNSQLGSWELSLAAFNMGYGALVRAIRKYNSNDFQVLSEVEAGLPYETEVYVRKILACAIVDLNRERFGLEELSLSEAKELVSIHLPGGTSLGRIARAAGLSQDELAALNPDIKRSRLPPDEDSWPVRIPADKLDRFKGRWKNAPPSGPSHGVHVLRFGERLKDVAEIYGTTESKLRRLNRLEDDEAMRPGRRLKVPDVAPRSEAGDDRPEASVVGVPERQFEYSDRQRVFYEVQPGDRLAAIAEHFQLGLDDLLRWNDVTTDAKLQSGMWLQLFLPTDFPLETSVVWRADQVRPLVVGSEAFLDQREAEQHRERIRYQVREGDTLKSLAERFELSVGSIARINGFSTRERPEPGSELVIYVKREGAAARN